MTAPRLRVDVERRLGRFALAVRLEVGAEIMVLFGPSGAGKSQTLAAIAGLAAPDAGEIVLDDRPLFRRGRPGPSVNLPARRRPVGLVFQQYALFPHLNARQNVAYALWRRPDAGARADELLARMHLSHLADRFPNELSGGQQQRVAIARTLAAEPRVVLLDEPFSALDANTRERLQHDLRALQREMGLVVLYVTHSLDEAFAVGDRIAVMRDGRVEQVGPIDAVLRHPVGDGVPEILGLRNIFRARVLETGPDGTLLDWDGLRLRTAPQAAAPGQTVAVCIRPEDVKVVYPDRPLTSAVVHNHVAGRIARRHRAANAHVLQVALPNGHQVEVRFPAYAYTPLRLAEGDEVTLALRREALVPLARPEPD